VTRTRRTRCASCNDSLTGAKVVIEGTWHCGACAYELTHGPTQRIASRTKTPEQQAQQGRLFPLPATTGKTASRKRP
jgi:hypothetical protein